MPDPEPDLAEFLKSLLVDVQKQRSGEKMGAKMIGRPGLYEGIPNDEYHGNLCVGPSLSSSGAREIVGTAPAKFWFNSYLNPNRPVEEDGRFDLGTAAHTGLLEPDTMMARIGIVEADDWKTKLARELRDQIRADGKTPLLAKQAVEISKMRDALYAHPIAKKLWSKGKAEATLVWRDALTETWLKCRPDFLLDSIEKSIDYKTTSRADRDAFARRMYEHGYHQQGAWCLDGIEVVTGTRPKQFILVAQETEAPYLVSVYILGHRAIEWGKLLNRRAINIFTECVDSGEWPGYAARAEELELPNFAEFQLEQRHEAGEFQRPSNG